VVVPKSVLLPGSVSTTSGSVDFEAGSAEVSSDYGVVEQVGKPVNDKSEIVS